MTERDRIPEAQRGRAQGRLLLLLLLLACSASPPTAPDADPIPGESAPAPAAAPLEGQFSGLAGHRARGAVSFRLADGVGEVRLADDFSSTPVPDPQLYVATEPNANRGTRLRIGLLQRSAGSQTYTFRLDDDTAYQYVLLWCDRYNVGVGAARLQ